LEYEAGDALGVLPVNCPELVNELVKAIGASSGELISSINGSPKSLSKAIAEDLFFGDQREAYDFLYQEMLEDYLAVGALTRLNTAFSRDGDKKVSVQDRMRESGKELWSWLERGAYFVVCGDASRLASDVDRALVSIVAEHGGMPEDQAIQYVKKFTASKRYVRDVY